MNWEGFLMGISDFGQERLKEERQKKMKEDLLELQQKHERESAVFKQKLKDKSDAQRVSSTRETADGQRINVNPFGQDIGDPFEVGAYEQEERDMARAKHEDSLLSSEHTRNTQSRTLDMRGQEMAERRAYRERDMGPGTGASTGQAVIDLVGDYKDLVDSYVTNDTFTMEEIYTMGNAALRSAATSGADVADTFRRTLTTTAGRRAGGVEGYGKRTPASIKRQLRTGSGG